MRAAAERWRRPALVVLMVLACSSLAGALPAAAAPAAPADLRLDFDWVSDAVAGQHFERAAMAVPIGSRQRSLQFDTGAGGSLVYAGAVPALERDGVLRRTERPDVMELDIVPADGGRWSIPVTVVTHSGDGEGLVGTLGMPALRDITLVIDYPAKRLHLLRRTELPAPPAGLRWWPMVALPQHFGVEARIDGVAIGPMLLDTGASPFGLTRWPQPDDALPAEVDAAAPALAIGADQTLEGAIRLSPLKGQHQVCLLGHCVEHETVLSSRPIIPGLRGLVGNRYFWDGLLVLDYAHQRALYADDLAGARRWLNLP